MFQEISYYVIFGKPLILYLGAVTLILLVITLSLGILFYTGKIHLKFKWHPTFAILTLIFAIIHGTLGMLLYF